MEWLTQEGGWAGWGTKQWDGESKGKGPSQKYWLCCCGYLQNVLCTKRTFTSATGPYSQIHESLQQLCSYAQSIRGYNSDLAE